MIATAIITAPRPRPTLEASLMTYRAAGFDNLVHVFADGQVGDLQIPRVLINYNQHRLGNLRNWVQALRRLERDTFDEYLMVCEDDITWSRRSRFALELSLSKLQWKAAGCMSLYLPDRMARMIPGGPAGLIAGLYPVEIGRKMWGAQCLLFPRAEAIALLKCDFFQHVLADKTKTMNVDAHIAESMLQRGKTILYRVPCLVDHEMGDQNSSLYDNKDRPELRTRYFWDPAC